MVLDTDVAIYNCARYRPMLIVFRAINAYGLLMLLGYVLENYVLQANSLVIL